MKFNEDVEWEIVYTADGSFERHIPEHVCYISDRLVYSFIKEDAMIENKNLFDLHFQVLHTDGKLIMYCIRCNLREYQCDKIIKTIKENSYTRLNSPILPRQGELAPV